MTWYFGLYLLLAVWVLYDANRRKNNRVGWPLATFLVGPLVLPFYFAKRHLRTGEVREGGTGWNVLKYFVFIWTLTMGVAAIVGIAGMGEAMQGMEGGAEMAGGAIGATIGIGLIAAAWFIPTVGALVIGLFLKKSSVVEEGPTGPLAESASDPK